ncbi:MAG: HAMP domain-containing histidine kinase [Leptospiraceae bacterium]|nr:HAMP domain-containing histidine kinase [Leptospiraceae bacterium]
MKPGKLYTKLFILFLLVLIASQLLVIFLHRSVSSQQWHSHLPRHINGQIRLLQDWLPLQIQASQLQRLNAEQARILAHKVVSIYESQCWIYSGDAVLAYAEYAANARLSAKATPPLDPITAAWHTQAGYRFRFRPDQGLRIDFPLTMVQSPTRIRLHVFKGPQSGYEILVSLAGVLLAFLILLWPFHYLFNKPVQALALASQRMAQGDLEIRVQTGAQDELGQLCRQFNVMADRIQALIENTRNMTARFSHEIRSPLSRIQLGLELLERNHQQKDARHLNAMRQEIELLNTIIGHTLDLAKARAGLIQNEKRPLAVGEWLQSELDVYRRQYRDRQLSIHFQAQNCLLPAEPWPWTMQALQALLDNAFKYTQCGGDIRIDLTREQLTINNTIPQALDLSADELTQAFIRGSQQHEFDGTGLGLALAKEILQEAGHKFLIVLSETSFACRIQFSVPNGPNAPTD